MRDRRLLYACAFLRALATGMVGILLGLYLARLELQPRQVGLVIAAGLWGAAFASLLATLLADRLGRRAFLVALAALAALGGLAVAAASSPLALVASAFGGMLNGMGRDRGAALVLEQAVLPATAAAEDRTRAFAWYNVLQDTGHALGSLAAGIPSLLQKTTGAGELSAMRAAFFGYAALAALAIPLYLGLSSAALEAGARARLRISAEARRTLARLGALFAIDGLGGGFLTAAMLSFFFFERFAVSGATIALLFFLARIANALSHLGSAWLARRIGLVNTMVFTHIPSSLLLVTVAFAPSFPVAAVLFLLREGLVEMDVPTRQSYVMAVVAPEERTFASGVTNLVRMGAWAAAPALAGLAMQGLSLMVPLLVGAGLKITYDMLLYRAFRHLRPPEEREA